MDRFMMRVSIGYPDRDQEILMASQFLSGQTPDTAQRVCSAEDILMLKKAVEEVEVNDVILGYIEDLIELTRKEPRFLLGASPWAMLSLIRCSQAKAFLQNRDYVKPDDVKKIAESVLLHRLVLTSEAKIAKEDAAGILSSLVLKARIPV